MASLSARPARTWDRPCGERERLCKVLSITRHYLHHVLATRLTREAGFPGNAQSSSSITLLHSFQFTTRTGTVSAPKCRDHSPTTGDTASSYDVTPQKFPHVFPIVSPRLFLRYPQVLFLARLILASTDDSCERRGCIRVALTFWGIFPVMLHSKSFSTPYASRVMGFSKLVQDEN